MENMKHKIIAIIDDENMVVDILDGSLYHTLTTENYKIYDSMTDISRGMHIDNYTDDGELLPLSTRVEKGLFKLDEGKILEGENVRDKTQVELYKDNPTSEINILRTIDTTENGREYVREKTILEQYNDSLISKDEYNSWAEEQRTEAYYNTTDKINSQIQNDTNMSEDKRATLEAQIEILKAEIKEKYPYVE